MSGARRHGSSSIADVWHVASFRFRSSLRRDFGSYVGLIVLIALIGGVAMAAVAAARRTQSSYPTFMRSTNPSDLTISYFDGAAPPELTTGIENLPLGCHDIGPASQEGGRFRRRLVRDPSPGSAATDPALSLSTRPGGVTHSWARPPLGNCLKIAG